MTTIHIRQTVAEMIAKIVAAHQEYHRLKYDEDPNSVLGAPCTAQQLASIERKFGTPLPPSYRAFLELHNGWANYEGDAKFLAVEDHEADWLKERIGELGESFQEFNPDGNPFSIGCLPVFLGPYESNYALIDPGAPTENGEYEVVSFDSIEEEERFPSFAEYLRDQLTLIDSMVDNLKHGSDD